MSLENLNLVELNAQEVQGIDGGFFPIAIYGVVIAAEYVATLLVAGVAVGTAVAQGQKK